jgi:DNA-binding CsgD family transcriptional regulator
MAAAYETLLATFGSEDFGPAVRDAVTRLSGGVRRIYLYEARGRDETHLHYYDCEPGIETRFTNYSRLYLQLDPLSEAFRATPRPNDMALQRVAPGDIASAGFRRQFFDEPGIVERISIVQRGADSWRGINLARHMSEGRFTDEEIVRLIGLAGIVLPMLPLNRLRRAPAPSLSAGQFEARFAARYPALPKREREVCARAAMGMSVEASALDLGIGKTSVLTYRQRAYRRLGVGSPVELAALVAQ